MQPRRIYVRAPNWVGDLVMATAALARIRQGFAGAHIAGGVRPYLRSLLDGGTFFDEVIDAPRAASARGLWRQAADLRRRAFDLAIVLPNSLETGLVTLLAGIPRRLGYRQGRPGVMNLGLRAPSARRWLRRWGPRRAPEPMPDYYDRLLDVLGLPKTPLRTSLAITPEERRAAEDWLAARGVDAGEPLLALNAGASFGASKLWEPERFVAVARHFRERHRMQALFLAGPAEAEMVRGLAVAAGALAAVDPVLPVGMLKPLLGRAALLVTTDSGPRHVALAVGTPVVCLIGPNDRRYTDYALERQVILRKDLPCSPCHRKTCPLGHRNCMRLITTDEVIAAAEGRLRG